MSLKFNFNLTMFLDLQFTAGIMDVNDNSGVFINNNNTIANREGHEATSGTFDKLRFGSSPRPKSDISSKELQNLNAPGDETSRFLEDFDPAQRRGAKKDSLSYSEKDSIRQLPTHQAESKPPMKHVLHNKLDLCDCLRATCPGCHFRHG